ncbi:hypothetical protein HYDPIDRAFT_65262, partial [Hydnomerulius pinastri MD-312]
VHNRPVTPMPDTFSYFIVYRSSHLKPKSVNVYMSGIVRELEEHFPDVKIIRSHPLVSRTLAGCLKRHASPVQRKLPLCVDDLHVAYTMLQNSTELDDQLFLAQLHVGFESLLRCGELTWPDEPRYQSYHKVSLRHTLTFTPSLFKYTLPSHKADRFGDGNTILIGQSSRLNDPYRIMLKYINSRNAVFPLHPELWLRKNGTIPTRSWFMRRLHRLFPKDISGHSMRSGGATAMVNAGIAPHLIQ